ncbi:hypothetical protein IL252_14275 (plasmid) [Halomicrobium sp. IBSBa]|uniref:hypothetical protein n=1 Tax=Halomicrobium sp. IBSBa TaxID=2778916 RepID=UPI001ABEFB61|nr:hypothetical protein [Halomicrobium sp. IBSBa]MBO4248985.1 hypothetical protein [Halomicrobium sp. IBSBa]
MHSEEGFLQLTDQHGVFGTFSLEPFNYEPAGVHRAGVDWDPENCYVKLQIRHDTGDEVRLSSDLKVDYRGRITGSKMEQRFTNPIRNCIMYKQTALVVLNLNEEGVTEPTCHSEDGENLFAIDPSGEITWRGQVVTLGDEQFLHRIHWLVGDHLFSKMASIDTGERIVAELDPKTGKIMATDI